MSRSIVPPGFELTSHKIFHSYVNPHCLPILFNGRDDNFDPSDKLAIPSAGDEKCAANDSSVDVPFCCPICLQSASDPVTLVACHHFFCVECIIKWFQRKLECPLCKVPCAYFVQPVPYVDGQFNLWKTASTSIGGNEIQGSLNVSSSMSLGLRRALKAHRTNFKSDFANGVTCNPMEKKAAVGVDFTPDERSTFSEAMMTTEPDQSTLMMETDKPSTATTNESRISVSGFNAHQMNDLGMVCDELQKLEDELKAEYGAGYG